MNHVRNILQIHTPSFLCYLNGAHQSSSYHFGHLGQRWAGKVQSFFCMIQRGRRVTHIQKVHQMQQLRRHLARSNLPAKHTAKIKEDSTFQGGARQSNATAELPKKSTP